VLRIAGELFKDAFRYRHGQLPKREFIRLCEDAEVAPMLSEIETRAFADWSRKEIAELREDREKNPDNYLEWKEEDTTSGNDSEGPHEHE
jgi:hypothetical protein